MQGKYSKLIDDKTLDINNPAFPAHSNASFMPSADCKSSPLISQLASEPSAVLASPLVSTPSSFEQPKKSIPAVILLFGWPKRLIGGFERDLTIEEIPFFINRLISDVRSEDQVSLIMDILFITKGNPLSQEQIIELRHQNIRITDQPIEMLSSLDVLRLDYLYHPYLDYFIARKEVLLVNVKDVLAMKVLWTVLGDKKQKSLMPGAHWGMSGTTSIELNEAFFSIKIKKSDPSTLYQKLLLKSEAQETIIILDWQKMCVGLQHVRLLLQAIKNFAKLHGRNESQFRIIVYLDTNYHQDVLAALKQEGTSQLYIEHVSFSSEVSISNPQLFYRLRDSVQHYQSIVLFSGNEEFSPFLSSAFQEKGCPIYLIYNEQATPSFKANSQWIASVNYIDLPGLESLKEARESVSSALPTMFFSPAIVQPSSSFEQVVEHEGSNNGAKV